MQLYINDFKLYLGVMSKNIVDAVISYVKEGGYPVGFIASRRQVDKYGGYCNGWSTKSFVEYVKGFRIPIPTCRDHGGSGQGINDDDGVDSLLYDAGYMDIIHVDPWKKLNMAEAISYTVDSIKQCLSINPNCLFEIGTEESIFHMDSDDVDFLITSVKKQLQKLFENVVYVVIQSGTSLESGINTGRYDEYRLKEMIDVCKKHYVFSKEHNGDYLHPMLIHEKFKLGLHAINIAPELANIETNILLNMLSKDKINKWFDLCMANGQWKKWFPNDFNPFDNRHKIVSICGHYVFNDSQFKDIINLNHIAVDVKNAISKFIQERIYYGY